MDIRIQVIHAGDVCVAPALPFGGESASALAVSGLFTRQDDRLWLPVFAYLIDHPRGFVLVDTGWGRAMSPEGRYDKAAQIAALGSRRLFRVNQGMVDAGCTVAEQLTERGLAPEDLACILLTHLDCDHVSGLRDLAGAPRVLTSADELASVRKNARSRLRYREQWWEGAGLQTFEWDVRDTPGNKLDAETPRQCNSETTVAKRAVTPIGDGSKSATPGSLASPLNDDETNPASPTSATPNHLAFAQADGETNPASTEGSTAQNDQGPFGRSFDLFGDGSIVCIAIPGHSDGLFAVKVTGEDGRFVLLCSDGAYGERSWRDLVLPGVATDREKQRASLEWIRAQSEDPLCIEVLASHDAAVKPHYIELPGLPEPTPAPVPISAPPDAEDDLAIENLRGVAGKAAVATMLAATLSAAPLNHTDFPLPEAVPIVQVISLDNPAAQPDNPDDDQNDSKASVWEKIMKILKYLLFALALVGAFALAAVSGCASCAGPVAAPLGQEASKSSSAAVTLSATASEASFTSSPEAASASSNTASSSAATTSPADASASASATTSPSTAEAPASATAPSAITTSAPSSEEAPSSVASSPAAAPTSTAASTTSSPDTTSSAAA